MCGEAAKTAIHHRSCVSGLDFFGANEIGSESMYACTDTRTKFGWWDALMLSVKVVVHNLGLGNWPKVLCKHELACLPPIVASTSLFGRTASRSTRQSHPMRRKGRSVWLRQAAAGVGAASGVVVVDAAACAGAVRRAASWTRGSPTGTAPAPHATRARRLRCAPPGTPPRAVC